MIQKPGWLIYAAQARKELDNVKPSKSGKREERFMLESYRKACRDFQYPGGEHEWAILLRRLGRPQKK